MKVRLFVVYPADGIRNEMDVDLAILTESDNFFWLEDLSHMDKVVSEAKRFMSNTYENTHEAISEILTSPSRITDLEDIHIVGDFEDVDEMCQWLQMQSLLDNINLLNITSLTK